MHNKPWTVEKPCDYCGKLFTAKRRTKWGEPRMCCSRECHWKKRGGMGVSFKCQNCEKIFHWKREKVRKERRFCGRKCAYDFWRTYGKPHKARAPHVNSAGYVYIYVPSHPSVQGKEYKRVAEHRIVMEQMLGRFLRNGESVHHKNGIKSDNRPENLELWNGRFQPSGQRCDDLKSEIKNLRMENSKLLKKIKKLEFKMEELNYV